MNEMFAEDCLGKRVQRSETHFKVRKDCFHKKHFASVRSTARVLTL